MNDSLWQSVLNQPGLSRQQNFSRHYAYVKVETLSHVDDRIEYWPIRTVTHSRWTQRSVLP
ncbi:hypothetical protein [Spirosoma validum]|uniref:Uncharacterized protein n=1 Tax=Spirosoma validum TaxID=2771355 RepID=A0A927B7E5_9BACT|nr:hypothetical protein [Spirosoma validum]MBD2756571.1 hypothetical protein [Spirosoma validum]